MRKLLLSWLVTDASSNNTFSKKFLLTLTLLLAPKTIQQIVREFQSRIHKVSNLKSFKLSNGLEISNFAGMEHVSYVFSALILLFLEKSCTNFNNCKIRNRISINRMNCPNVTNSASECKIVTLLTVFKHCRIFW